MRQRILLVCCALLWPLFGSAAAWPERPIRILVPFPAGGPNDAVARLVAEPLAQRLGQSVVIENRAGASGTIGSEAGAKATADGYTLTLGSTSSHSLPTVMGQKIGYSPTGSFAPVGLIARTPTVLLVNTKLGVRNYAEFLALARSRPGRLSYGSSGAGTLNHLLTEQFKGDTGIFMVHIPYRGTGQAMTDLLGGQIDAMFDAVITATPQIKSGKLRALAVTGAQRTIGLPDVPTLDELGLKGFEGSLWVGLLAPAGTPTAVTERLNRDLQATLNRPEVRERLAALGFEALPGSPAAMAQYMQAVQGTWSRVVRERQIRAE